MGYLFVGIGGIIGSVLRYYISVIMGYLHITFPLATLTVNLIGSFLLGFLLYFLSDHQVNQKIRNGICTGLIGSFTTFSAFSVDLLLLIEKNQLIYALLYFFISAVGGILFAWTGFSISQLFTKEEKGGAIN